MSTDKNTFFKKRLEYHHFDHTCFGPNSLPTHLQCKTFLNNSDFWSVLYANTKICVTATSTAFLLCSRLKWTWLRDFLPKNLWSGRSSTTSLIAKMTMMISLLMLHLVEKLRRRLVFLVCSPIALREMCNYLRIEIIIIIDCLSSFQANGSLENVWRFWYRIVQVPAYVS